MLTSQQKQKLYEISEHHIVHRLNAQSIKKNMMASVQVCHTSPLRSSINPVHYVNMYESDIEVVFSIRALFIWCLF